MVRRVWRFLLPADHGIGGLICPCLVTWSPWFIFLLYTYDYLYFILFSFQISVVICEGFRLNMICTIRDVDCCAHKKSFNTAIPVRSLGPYMYVHYCTYIVHILVKTYLFLLTSFFDYLSFVWIVF